jgi:hypothetical protein
MLGSVFRKIAEEAAKEGAKKIAPEAIKFAKNNGPKIAKDVKDNAPAYFEIGKAVIKSKLGK